MSKRPLWRGRTLILVGILLAAFNLRTAVTAPSPLFGPIGADLHFDTAFIGVLGLLPPAAFAVFGYFTPFIAHRVGLERLALLGMLLAGAGQLARSFVGESLGFLIWSIVALAGMGIGNVVIPPLVKRYFPDRVGTLSTMYLVVLQTGTFVPPLLAIPIADGADWRFSVASWSVLAFLAALPWIGVLITRRRQKPTAGSAEDSAAGSVGSAGVDEAPELATADQKGRVWRSSVGLGLTLMFATTSLNTYAMFTWIPEILIGAGSSEAFAGTMLSLFAGLGLVSGLAMPSVATRARKPFGYVLASVFCFLAGYTGLYLAPTTGTVVWICLIGLGPSTFPMGLTMINVRSRTPIGSTSLSGFVQGVGYAIACLGPLTFGLFHDATGGWGLSFIFLVAMLILLLIGGWYACRPLFVEDTWHRRAKG
ncbi:MFS transporter [Saxibacter everestensis]|uniref:MFS transporter n=1 Tax=Saxibacter everestensis TaxID=2909229 RepID=A0ABY8QNH9_9MICO|nr:MFS transporter [Brevibacteriaceae bacterium ZFBP1038]